MFPKRSRRSILGVAAVGAALALALTACGPSGEGPDDANGAPAAEAPGLAVSSVSAPNSLDTAQLVDGNQMYVWSSIYDTLLMRDPETGELKPNAAESWEYNEDGTELTLVLREGMTFSNGNPVNAEAVAATMLRTRDTPGIVQPKYALVEDVIAADDLTVVVSFSEFDPQFVWNLPLAAGAIGDPESLDSAEAATNPIGSGPYTLDVAKTVPGTTYVLTKRDDYWNADSFPYPTFTVRVLQDPTASFNALQAGEINASTVQAQVVSQLDTSTYSTKVIDTQAIAYLDILDRGGEKWPALGDVRVRQAINHAIDREGVLKGLFTDTGLTTTQIFTPNGEVNDESLDATYEYDPEKGRALVEEAGYTGETFQIPSTFLTTTIEATLSQAFEDIGLGLEWVTVPPQQAQSALQSGEYGLTYQITGPNSDPADAFFHFSPSGFGNPRGYTNPELDAFFDVINSTVEFEDAVSTYRELNAYAVEQAYEAPIVFVGATWATRDGIEYIGYGGAPSTTRNFAFTG